jgi:hypothetical protein
MVKRFSWLVVCALLLMFFTFGCGETTRPEKVTAENKADFATESTKTPEVYAVGDSVKMGGLVFTVNGTSTSTGSEFFRPDNGNIYFIVDCTIENSSNEAVHLSSLLMFSLVDAEGYNYNITIGPETKGSLDGELAPGRKMRGELAFEVPAQANSLELIFEPNVFGSGQAIYKVK